MRKCFQNDAKTRSKIYHKSITFQNLRFLDFCEEYNVKIVFSHDRGYQKSFENPKKSKQIRRSKKVCRKHGKLQKMEPKWEPKSMKIHTKTMYDFNVKN